MTGYESKRAAAQDKLDDDDTLTIAYQSGFYDGKKAAQPAQEPVTWAGVDFDINTTPPQRPWVGLTHAETKACMFEWDGKDAYVLCRAIEAKLKEKNT